MESHDKCVYIYIDGAEGSRKHSSERKMTMQMAASVIYVPVHVPRAEPGRNLPCSAPLSELSVDLALAATMNHTEPPDQCIFLKNLGLIRRDKFFFQCP